MLGQLVRSSLIGLCNQFGVQPSRLADPKLLKSLLQEIAPIDNGWPLIRVGPNSDSGYLLPNDLEGIRGCVSPGVCESWAFEQELESRFDIPSVMIDASVRPPVGLTTKQIFLEKWLGVIDDSDNISLQGLFRQIDFLNSGDLLLQMDIEGAEYQTLLATTIEDLSRFRVMVIEFHYLQHLFNNFAFSSIFAPLFKKLTANHDVVHIHPNNETGIMRYKDIELPRTIEITFHRKDRSKGDFGRARIPHPLDFDNNPANNSLRLKF
jgi:hypothetical protein